MDVWLCILDRRSHNKNDKTQICILLEWSHSYNKQFTMHLCSISDGMVSHFHSIDLIWGGGVHCIEILLWKTLWFGVKIFQWKGRLKVWDRKSLAYSTLIDSITLIYLSILYRYYKFRVVLILSMWICSESTRNSTNTNFSKWFSDPSRKIKIPPHGFIWIHFENILQWALFTLTSCQTHYTIL